MPITFTIESKKRRRLTRISLGRLQRQTGYHKSHLSRVFARKTQPSVECLGKLAAALGLTIDDTWARIENRKFRLK